MGTKITKQLLQDYKKIKREIPILEAELEDMMTTDSGLGNDTILDYRDGYPRPQSIIGFDRPLYERRKKIVEHKKAQVQTIEDWINAIEDGQVRYVFKMKYIEGMSWVKIAAKTGYKGNYDYPRLYIRDSYLKKSGIK